MEGATTSRYAKQELFWPIGKNGQAKISAATVTVIGLGALGTVSSSHLCRAGVGRLRLVDRDFVEIGNLQRQLLFDEEDALKRLPKAIAASEKLKKTNSEIVIEHEIADVEPRNVEALLAESDLVIDATDNLETRFLINDACLKKEIPWIYTAALGSTGVVMTIVPGQTSCLRCHIDHLPPAGAIASCDTEGVLSMTTTAAASLQCAEALRLLVGLPPTEGMLYFDTWERSFETFYIDRKKNCPACGLAKYEFLDGTAYSFTTVLCGRNAVQIQPPAESQVDLELLADRLQQAGEARFNGFLLSFKAEGYELVLFPTGRAIIRGTNDEAEARNFYARFIGT